MKKKLLGCLLLCAILAGVLLFRQSPVEQIGIEARSVRLLVGDSMQLTANGLLKNGDAVPPEQMEKLSLQWRTQQREVLTVDESGVLTGLKSGVGNVQAYSERYDLYSRPITVYVE